MKKVIFIVYLVLAGIALSSCGTMRFSKKAGLDTKIRSNELDGEYCSRIFFGGWNIRDWENYNSLAQFFGADNKDFPVESVALELIGPDSLKVTFRNELGDDVRYFKGELKDKFFEIYFSKKQVIVPLFYSRVNVNRVRLGKTKDGDLRVIRLVDFSGNVLLIGGGSGSEDMYTFECINKKKLVPVEEGNKWGYVDSDNNMVIAPQYDYACLFDRETARVKLDGKWGVIDNKGSLVIAAGYDYIYPLDTLNNPGIYNVTFNGKHGLLSEYGKEIIPVVYDRIGNYYNGFCSVQLNGKYGRASLDGVVIPAAYDDEIKDVKGTEYGRAKRDGKMYLMDMQGYEYDYRTKLKVGEIFSRKRDTESYPDESTKRKIKGEEELME